MFDYCFNGQTLRWIPDFRLVDGTFLEIKGYESEQTRAKFAHFPHRLRVLRRADMNEVFDYVWRQFGRDFIRLYE